LFADEAEQYGEDAATKTKTARERILKARDELKEYTSIADVLGMYKGEDGKIGFKYADNLVNRERGIQAERLAIRHLLNISPADLKRVNEFVEELTKSNADSPEKLEEIAKKRAGELNAKPKQTHKPAPTRPGGGGAVDMTKKTNSDNIALGLKKLK
jgi:hypothetical protein